MTAQTGKPASWKVNAYKSLFRNFIWEKIDAHLSSGSLQMFFVEQAGNLSINLNWSLIFVLRLTASQTRSRDTWA